MKQNNKYDKEHQWIEIAEQQYFEENVNKSVEISREELEQTLKIINTASMRSRYN